MNKFWPPNPAPTWVYASKVDAHQVRRNAERLGKEYDKQPKADVKTFEQALTSGEASSSTSSKGKVKAKGASDRSEKPNHYCNILNLAGSKNNNLKASTLAAYAKSNFGLDLTEVRQKKPQIIHNYFFFQSFYYILTSLVLIKS